MTTFKYGTPIEDTGDFSNVNGPNVLATQSYVTNGTSGWATNSANSYSLNNQNSAFYLNRSNHTGTQLASSISDFATAVSGGTSGWATNAGYAYSTGDFGTNGLTK